MKQSKHLIWIQIILLFVIFTHLKAQPVRDYRILISSYQFDPLIAMPTIAENLKVKVRNTDSTYQLIQFQHSLSRQEMEILRKEHNLKLDQYIPNFTYLEFVNDEQLSRISRLPFYRWHGIYEPGYKVSQAFGKREETVEEDARKYEKLIEVHRFQDVESVETALRNLGVDVIQTWNDEQLKLKRIKIKLENLELLPDLLAIPGIKSIDEFGQIQLRNQTASWIIQTNVNNSRTIYDNGLRGNQEIVGHIDGPLDINHCFFQDSIDNTPGPVHRKVVAYHRSGGIPTAFNDHGTHTAGTIAGQDLITPGTTPDQRSGQDGHAFRARISHTDLSDINGSGTNPSNLKAAFEDMYSDGARVYTNSWGDDGTTAYTTWCVDIDQFAWDHEDVLVVHAVTNGTNLKTPENAKNTLAVAQSGDTPNQNNSDGGNGPTDDNRRKPEITAPGLNITSADGNTACGTRITGGTSMATPAVAGYGSIARQYYREGWYPLGIKQPSNGFVPSGSLIKATLLNSTVDMTGNDDSGSNLNGYPTNMEGWGRLLLENAMYFQGDAQNLMVWDILHESGLNTGETRQHFIDVETNTVPLKVTLVWAEPPAAVNATTASINDLNLVVTDPTGIIYQGNDFTNSQSTANGALIDSVNNVEMVQVNTPNPGRYIVQINARQVNQGNPSQGYALVATADTPEPPAPIGAQNTLVVLTSLPGTTPAGAPSVPNAQNLINDLNTYISEVSYGQTTINPSYVNIALTTTLGSYLSLDSNPLIELTQDAVAELVSANPNVFDQGTADPTDDIDRIMILLNDQGFTGDWATTGPWPYELPSGLTERLSVSVSSVFNDPEKRLNHALCHQLGMVDLYNHPGVVFAQPHVDNWDIMANLNIVQPMAWSKERAEWLSSHNPNSIRWIPRPAAGASFNQTIPINWLSSTDTSNPRAIAVGLTPGVTNLANENVFYFIEARTSSIGVTDQLIPEDNSVLLYYVNENIRQGEGPVRIIDQDLTTANSLDDAAYGAGIIPPPAGTGLGIEVLNPTGTEAFRIKIDYDPPETTNDMNIRVGDPHWTSPDIWVDSQVDGYDVESGRLPADRGNDPVAGEDNRIYFTVYNPGPGDAFDVTVSVNVSEPYHTVGGAADFNRFINQKFYTQINAGGSVTDYVVWRPNPGDDPHSCIKVKIHEVFNDVNDYNNSAQQNVREAQSATASPFEPVVYQFSVTNPYDYYQLFYFRLEGLPIGWTYHFTDKKRRLSAYERYEGSLTVYPPEDAQVCTDHDLYVTSWMPKGNTMVPYGGATLQVNLRNRTTLTANTQLIRCERKQYLARSSNVQMSAVSAISSKPKCFNLVTAGCTDPIKANEEIVIRYEDPDGNPVYRVVTTDEYGCYSDTYVVTDGGEWKVKATYYGDECSGATTTGATTVPVDIPGSNGIFEGLGKKMWVSAHVGSTHPLGALNDDADASIYAAADLTFPFNDNLNMSVIFGLAQMSSEIASASEHPRWYHLSANLEVNFPRPQKMKPYVRFGPGYYRDKNNNNSAGLNIGIGAKSRINNELIITPGLDFHYSGIGNDNRQSFLTMHIGIIFK